MTRFARARGSKSSNERLPECPTSWQIMKQQMQERKTSSSSKHEAQIKETRTSVMCRNKDNTEGEWAVFEESAKSSSNVRKKHKNYVSLKSNTQISENEESYSKNTDKLHKVINKNSKVERKESKKSKKLKGYVKLATADSETEEVEKHVIQVKKPKKKKKKQNSNSFQVEDLNDKMETAGNETPTTQDRKKKKEKKNKQRVSSQSNDPQCGDKHARSSTNNEGKFQQSKNYNAKNKFDPRGVKSNKTHKRRKPETPTAKLFINGKEIEIIKFDGFPVKKEDGERLKELRKKLLDQGIPRSEVVHTMKLERRRAEKALARERKKVCFHCRKAGHLLSECPELGNSTESTTGICFKCGSTEHTHFQCKVTRSQDFRYAECFICKEQGHIARQCPDNPRGLYPKGGACKVCGDVTHLKKDCPDLMKEKEQQTITLETLNSNSLEVLDEEVKENRSQSPQHKKKPPKNKIVKF